MVILFDAYNLPDDIYEIVFATEQQVVVGRMLADAMKRNNGEFDKTAMSLFATKLHDGVVVEYTVKQPFPVRKKEKISYNKRQFYDRILTPMKTMGMIDYDNYRKVYKISDKFSKNLMALGYKWLEELRKNEYIG
jgi:hypothetical protein